jgi:hypothetical protein
MKKRVAVKQLPFLVMRKTNYIISLYFQIKP